MSNYKLTKLWHKYLSMSNYKLTKLAKLPTSPANNTPTYPCLTISLPICQPHQLMTHVQSCCSCVVASIMQDTESSAEHKWRRERIAGTDLSQLALYPCKYMQTRPSCMCTRIKIPVIITSIVYARRRERISSTHLFTCRPVYLPTYLPNYLPSYHLPADKHRFLHAHIKYDVHTCMATKCIVIE